MNTLTQNPHSSQQSIENSTDVVILGGRYTIKSGYSSAVVERTARLVNEKLGDIIQGSGVVSTDKVAILACMNIASELLKLQEDHQLLKTKMKGRIERILSTLDTSLSQEEIGYLTGSK